MIKPTTNFYPYNLVVPPFTEAKQIKIRLLLGGGKGY